MTFSYAETQLAQARFKANLVFEFSSDPEKGSEHFKAADQEQNGPPVASHWLVSVCPTGHQLLNKSWTCQELVNRVESHVPLGCGSDGYHRDADAFKVSTDTLDIVVYLQITT